MTPYGTMEEAWLALLGEFVVEARALSAEAQQRLLPRAKAALRELLDTANALPQPQPPLQPQPPARLALGEAALPPCVAPPPPSPSLPELHSVSRKVSAHCVDAALLASGGGGGGEDAEVSCSTEAGAADEEATAEARGARDVSVAWGEGGAPRRQQAEALCRVLQSKIEQLGWRPPRLLFSHVDPAGLGRISAEALRRAVAVLGVALAPADTAALEERFGVADASGLQLIDYHALLRALESEHGRAQSASHVAFSAAMLGKDAPSPRELARASRSATPPLHVRAADGLRALRERLAARHASRRAAFAQLPTDGGGRVAMGALVAGLHVLGFPRSLCDASELRQVVRGFAASPAALSISFAEFCELLAADATRCAAALRAASDEGAAASSQQQQQQQQQQQKLQVAAAASALARSSELAAVKGKLRSGSMRELFLALDADRDGFVSLSDAARGLGAHGLSQPSAASAALAALLEAHARTRGGMLSFAELAAFVQEDASGLAATPALPRPQPRGGSNASGAPQSTRQLGESLSAEEALALLRAHAARFEARLEELLRAHDLEGDGTLSESEFEAAMTAMGVRLSRTTTERLFAIFPTRERRLVWRPLLDALLGAAPAQPPQHHTQQPEHVADASPSPSPPTPPPPPPPHAALLAALCAAANENGKSSRVFKELATGDRRLLSRRELAAGLSRLGVAFEPAEIHSLFGEFATGDGGRMSYGDFVRMLSRSSSASSLAAMARQNP